MDHERGPLIADFPHLKTLHIDTGREMRGGQWQVLYLAERLSGAALLAREDSPLFLEARARGLDVLPLSLGRIGRGYDLVHAHDARAHTIAAMVPGIRLVVSRRVAFPVKTGLLSKLKYARPDLFVAVSNYVGSQLALAGIEERKIRVVYDGVPPPPLPSKAECGRVVALRSKSVAIPGVKIHFISDLWQDLSTASVFVYFSEMEGLGSAVLAAMAAGVPVVASRVGGLPEIVEHERTGLLVENPHFSDAVRHLLENPALAAEMGRRGRELVEQRFTADRMVEQTMRVYKEVLG